MQSAVIASILSFLLLSGTTTQSRPDFSGNWRFDPNRSDSATYPELNRPVSIVVTQTPSEVRVDTTTGRGMTTEVAKFVGGDVVQAAGATVARWRGNTLVIDAVRDIRGQSVTVQQTMTLSPDGNELIVESTVNVQHGYSLSGAKVYGAGKDVFVRVK